MRIFLSILLLQLINSGIAFSQSRVVADASLVYSISAEKTANDKDLALSLAASSKTVYLKGNDCRVDLFSPSFSQSLIYDKLTGTAVVLREFGNNKFISKLDKNQWLAENKQYQGMKLELLNNQNKSILGYNCINAMIQLTDGTIFHLFYTPSIIPSVREFEFPFKDIPGFVLEFETIEAGKKIKYTATSIQFSPVPSSKFTIPSSGYRLLQ